MTNSDGGNSRRDFLKLSAAVSLAAALPPTLLAIPAFGAEEDSSAAPLNSVLARVLGSHAQQIQLQVQPRTDAERFSIAGSRGQIQITGSSPSAAMMGVNWYLKYVAGVSVSWNGDSLDRLPTALPSPPSPITISASAEHRFALNDTNDG